VGKTTQSVEQRFSQHTQPTNSCAFTSKFKPVKIVQVIKSSDPLDEDKVTKRYMMKYGIENVRGGAYTKLELEDWQIKSLEHEFVCTNDLCLKCGMSGHFTNACPKLIFDVDKYVEKFTDEPSINQIIKHIRDKLNKIQTTNIIIDETNQFTVDFYNNFNCVNVKIIPEPTKKADKNISSGDAQILKLFGKNKFQKELLPMYQSISRLYQKHLDINDYQKDFPTEIKILELIYHNQNMKKQLNALLTEFKTEEIMVDILTKLYEKLVRLN